MRPVEAVQTWLPAAEINDGPVFRPVLKGSRIQAMALAAHAVAAIMRPRPACGASVFKMMEVSRHKSVDPLRGYVRRADLFKEHAGAAFL